MAIRFFDGFEQYDSGVDAEIGRHAAAPGWSVLPVSGRAQLSSTTRYGYGKSFQFINSANTMTLSLGENATTIVLGRAYRDGATTLSFSTSANAVITLFDGASSQLLLGIDTATRLLKVCRGNVGAVIATGTTPIAKDGWYYIEMKVVLDQTNGSAEVRVNGATDINVTGVDTCGSTTTVCNSVTFGSGGAPLYVDDVYWDDSDFQGDVAVVTSFPDGAGSSTGWTPSAGANYAAVDEAPSDGETTYVEAAPIDALTDLYTVEGWPAGLDVGQVLAVQQGSLMRKTDVGEAGVQLVLKSGATTSTGSREAANSVYTYHRRLFTTDPNTGAAWTKAAYEALETGQKAVV